MLTIEFGDGEHFVDVGGRATFGRSGDDDGHADVDITIGDDDRLHRRIGELQVLDDGWVLHNTGRWLRVRISDDEGTGFDAVPPGVERRVPWRTTRVDVLLGDATYGFVARHAGIDARPAMASPASTTVLGNETRPTVLMDRTAGYYRALVALCAPRLLGPSNAPLATNAEIARALNCCGAESRHVTTKTVERRLDYCGQLLGLKGDRAKDARPAASRGRDAVAEVALATGLVSAEDLGAVHH